MKRIGSLIIIIGISLTLGGCNFMGSILNNNTENEDNLTGEEKQKTYEEENFVRVQDYTGEGYEFKDSVDENLEVAEENREEVVEAVKKFFVDKYKTEIEVKNMVSVIDGVAVFVESVGEPHFYVYVIVPIDLENREVKTESVWSLEGDVERAIQGGLYAMAFDEEFAKLDEYFESLTEEYPVVGITQEALEKIEGAGYATPYYFTAPADDLFDELYLKYMQNPSMTKRELKQFFNNNSFDVERVLLTINLYMKEENIDPNQERFNQIVNDIEKMEGIPRANYSIALHDNYIDKRRADGDKENSLILDYPNEIIKD